MSGETSETRIKAVLVLTIAAIAIVLAVQQLPKIKLQNDLKSWLSEDDDQARALRRMETYFPPEEIVLVSWDSSSLDDSRTDQFRDHASQSPHIEEVQTAADLLDRMTEWNVDRDEAIRRLTGVLIGPPRSEGHASAVVLKLSDRGMSDPTGALATIRKAAVASDIEPDELRMDGALITSHSVDREAMAAVWNPVDPLERPPVFLFAAIAGVLLAFLVLRSVRLGLMVLIAAWFTALITTALIPAVGHSMNMVTMVVPTLLVVLTISAAIHVANYWKRAASSGSGDAVREAVRMGWQPCLMATATTGIGLLSLTISELEPIWDFGAFSAIGVFLSFVVVIVGLPAMLRLSNPAATGEAKENRLWGRVARTACRHRTAIIAGSLLLGLSATAGLHWLKTEVKVRSYFPEDARLSQDSRFLEQNIGGTSSVELLVHFGPEYDDKGLFLERLELVREIEESIRKHPDITGAISLADFSPVRKRPAPGEGLRFRYGVRSKRTEKEMKTEYREDIRDYLALGTDPDAEWTRDSELDETWRITAQTLIGKNQDYGTLTRELGGIVAAHLGNAPGTWYDVTGSIPVFYRAQTALLDSLIQSMGLACVAIAITLIILLRSVPAGLMSSLPGVFPIAVVFGMMSWSGQVLDIGTMLTGSVALGIAVDDMLHLLTWFRAAIREGKSRQEAVVQALRHCGPAMTQTTLVIGLSLLLLYPAELLLISRFGWVMATLLGLAWLSSVTLLPALLAGPLGALIEQVELRPTVPARQPSGFGARPMGKAAQSRLIQDPQSVQ